MSGRVRADAVAAALGAEDAEERRQAALRLRDLDPGDAAPLLLRALGDDDWRVRKEATFAGARLLHGGTDGGLHDAVLAALLSALAPSDNVGLRNAAIEVLGQGGGAAIPALAGALPALDADGRKLLVEALSRTRDPAAVDALERALSDPDGNVRQAAIEAIASMGTVARGPAAAILRRSLSDADRFVRLTALLGLNALEEPVPWPVLASLLDDSMLRPAGLSAAALAESPDAPAALVRMLATARGSAFAQALAALARLADGPLKGHVAEALRGAGAEVGARLARVAAGAPASRVTAPSAPDLPDIPEPPSWSAVGVEPASHRARALVLAAVAGAAGAADAAVAALAEPSLAEPAQRALSLLGSPALPALFAEVARRLDAGSDDLDRPEEATAALIDVAVAIARDSETASGPPAKGAEPAWPELLAILRRAASISSTLIATSALYGLAKLGRTDDLPLVADRTLAEALPVAYAAEAALASLSERHPEAARSLGRGMMSAEAASLPAVIVLEALGADAPDEVAFLMHAAAAGDARARRAAVRAVVAAAGLGSLDVLSLALADEEPQVRRAAAHAVGRLSAAFEGAAAPAGVIARIRELLALVRGSGDADLWAAARRDGAAEGGGDPEHPEESPP